jgi:hypothetical protein
VGLVLICVFGSENSSNKKLLGTGLIQLQRRYLDRIFNQLPWTKSLQQAGKMSFQPTQIFGEGTTEEKGENARLAAFVGAIAVGDLVKSTLGPKGMDKILQSG